MKISIAVSDDIIHLLPNRDIDEIEETLDTIRDLLHAMLEKEHRQAVYQKRYGIAKKDIAANFNGDMLQMAIGIRGVSDEEIADKIGVQALDISDMLSGLVKPLQIHHDEMAQYLQFPLAFFTLEGEIRTDNRFMCSMPSWAGENRMSL